MKNPVSLLCGILLCIPVCLAADGASSSSFLSEGHMGLEKVFDDLKQRIGYDEAIRKESKDGLILIDFRKTSPPPSVRYENWSYFHDKERGYAYFDWSTEGDGVSAVITAYVYEDYESARQKFFDGALTSRYPLPWVACDKKIGTICAAKKIDLSGINITLPPRFSLATRIFFTYKNVYIDIHGKAEYMAEWLFGILKKHPLSPMLPPGPLVLGKAGYPAPKTGYWKAYLPLEVSQEEARRINALFPLRVREGERLVGLGYAPPIGGRILWFWLGDNPTEQRLIAEAGMLALRRHEQERRDLYAK
jgi:hypothetical protein